MLDRNDVCEQLGIDLETLGYLHAKRLTPEPIRVGGEPRWREEDIELFSDYLIARHECRESGIDPNGPDGPAVPIYSHGLPVADIREIVRQQEELERQSRSRTLRAGSQSIKAQKVALPEIATGAQIEEAN